MARSVDLVSSPVKSHIQHSLMAQALPEMNLPGQRTPGEDSKTQPSETISYSGFSTDLQQLKESIDIVSVVESYDLQGFHRSGDRATALCPFHNDHNPSMSIDSTRQIYKCFSCGAGGDVYKFVQEYSKLPGNEDMTFGQTISFLSSTFGDGSLSPLSKTPRILSEHEKHLEEQKNRILLINAAAATFYSDCLKQPFAGGARYHIISRGLSAWTIPFFGMGFAPDAFYSGSSPWGEGSLINYLQSLGFNSTEMVKSGLAIRTKRADEATAATVDDYTALMDRFRNRIIVPIFDKSGLKVLGFGGREIVSAENTILETPGGKSYFKSPKYLNSPESMVFSKKTILFNQHIAQKSIDSFSDPTCPPSVLIVEGYMDAIALCDTGIENVVACMGTAISSEHLSLATKMVETRGGRVIFCMDNDAAGLAAVERLCSNGMLGSAPTRHAVEFNIAQLPDRIKDPAEFIDAKTKLGSTPAEIRLDFQSEICDGSLEWTEWFIAHIMNDYNPSAVRNSYGSFSNIFNRIADFIASSLDSGERTKRAFEISSKLARILAKEQNVDDLSSSVRIQLESDLIELVARLSETKAAILRRAEAVGQSTPTETNAAVTALAKGAGPSSSRDEKLSRVASDSDSENLSSDDPLTHYFDDDNIQPVSASRRRPKYRARITRHQQPESLTPHFSGFRFSHESDKLWLGLEPKRNGQRNQNEGLLLGRPQDGVSNPSAIQKEIVYFNSADFNGEQFLTNQAMDAGYSSSMMKPDSSVIEKGLATLVEQDTVSLIKSAENSLFRILLQQRSARKTLHRIMNARMGISASSEIQWSSPAKKWLFECLVGNTTDLQLETNERSELHTFLSELPSSLIDESKEYAITEVGGNTTENPSVASRFQSKEFIDELVQDASFDFLMEDESTPMSHAQNDLAAQEILATLMWASTSRQATLMRNQLAESLKKSDENHSIQSRKGQDNLSGTENYTLPSAAPNFNFENLNGTGLSELKTEKNSIKDLTAQQMQLLSSIRDTTHLSRVLKESCNRITTRLLDENHANGIEGQISSALQADLASQLDEHIHNISHTGKHTSMDDHFAHEEPYEDALERMSDEWGEWFDDDYVWTPSMGSDQADSNAITLLELQGVDDDRETLDEFNERIDREWAGWDD